MSEMTMTHERFDEQLSDYLELALDRRERAAMDAHAAACERCGALLADLQQISVQASHLPVLTPSRDLWNGIADRIAAPVVSIAPAAETGKRGWSVNPRWLAAAAAVLVIATAGITWSVTRSLTPQTVVASSSPVASPVDSSVASPVAPSVAVPSSTQQYATPLTPRGNPGGHQRTELVSNRAEKASTTYDREITSLRRIVNEHASQMDPKTRAILEHNLKIIDDAIAQSRAALASDPNSDYLGKQLDSALEQKLELLRTAALLPRT